MAKSDNSKLKTTPAPSRTMKPPTGSVSTRPKPATETNEKKASAPGKTSRKIVPAQPAEMAAPVTNGALPSAKSARAPSTKQRPPNPLNYEEVALRAYFISERRRSEGIPGEAQLDWLEAERQVRSEALAKKTPGAARRKNRV